MEQPGNRAGIRYTKTEDSPDMNNDQLHDRRDNIPIFIHSVVDDLPLHPYAFRVYGHLARRAGTGQAWPSYQSIGDQCFGAVSEKPGSRRRLAIKWVKNLIEHGMIHKEKRDKSTNIYTLTPSAEWRFASDGGSPDGDCGSLDDDFASDGGSPKGTPLTTEDTPLEEEKISANADPTHQPEETEPEKPAIITDIQTFEEKGPDIESGGSAPSEWQEQVGALCWVCYGHQDVSLLMKEQRGQLLREAKVIFKEKGYTVGELRTWYKSEWRKRDWRGKKGDRPQPSWVRSGIATVRAQPDETTSIWDRMDLMADRILGMAA